MSIPQDGYFQPKDLAIQRLLEANAMDDSRTGHTVVVTKETRRTRALGEEGKPHDHHHHHHHVKIENRHEDEETDDSNDENEAENQRFLEATRDGGVERDHNLRKAGVLADKASNLLNYLESELDGGLGTRSAMMKRKLLKQIESMTPVTSLLETFSIEPHPDLMRSLNIRVQQIAQDEELYFEADSIPGVSSQKSMKKTAASELHRSFEIQQKALTAAYDSIEKLQTENEDLKLKTTLTAVTEAKSRASRIASSRSSRINGSFWGQQSSISFGTPVTRTRLPSFSDTTGPISGGSFFVVAVGVKGPILNHLWRRESSTMFEAYARCNQLVLQTATSTSGWVMANEPLQHTIIFFETSVNAFSFCSMVHEGLIKIPWGMHLLKFPGYKPYSEQKANGKSQAHVWKGLRVAIGVHMTPPKPPHCDTNPVTGRTGFASYDVVCAVGLAKLASGGETLVSSAAWVKATAANPAMKVGFVVKMVQLETSEEEAFGYTDDVKSSSVKNYTVYRVLPLALSHRMKHLQKLEHAVEGSANEPKVTLTLDKIRETLGKDDNPGSPASSQCKKIILMGTSKALPIDNLAVIKKAEGLDSHATIAAVTVPGIKRMMETSVDATHAVVSLIVTKADELAQGKACNGVLVEVARDEIVFLFPNISCALQWADQLHSSLMECPIPRGLERYWFVGQDPLHLDATIWRGTLPAVGIHTGHIEPQKSSTGFTNLRGPGRSYASALSNTARAGETLVSAQAIERLPNPHSFNVKLMCDLSTFQTEHRCYRSLPNCLLGREKILGRLQLHKLCDLRDRYEELYPPPPPPPEQTPPEATGNTDPAGQDAGKKDSENNDENSDQGSEPDSLEITREEELPNGCKMTQTEFQAESMLQRDKCAAPLFSSRAQEIIIKKAQDTGLPLAQHVRGLLNVMLKMLQADKSLLRKVVDSTLTSLFYVFDLHATELRREIYGLKEALKQSKRHTTRNFEQENQHKIQQTSSVQAEKKLQQQQQAIESRKHATVVTPGDFFKQPSSSTSQKEAPVSEERWFKSPRITPIETLIEMQDAMQAMLGATSNVGMLHRERHNLLTKLKDVIHKGIEAGTVHCENTMKMLESVVEEESVKAANEPSLPILAKMMQRGNMMKKQRKQKILENDDGPVETSISQTASVPPLPNLERKASVALANTNNNNINIDTRIPEIGVFEIDGVYSWDSGNGLRHVVVRFVKEDTVSVTLEGGHKVFNVQKKDLRAKREVRQPVIVHEPRVPSPVEPSHPAYPAPPPRRSIITKTDNAPPKHHTRDPKWDAELINAMLRSHHEQRYQPNEVFPLSKAKPHAVPPKLPAIAVKPRTAHTSAPVVDYGSPLLILQKNRDG